MTDEQKFCRKRWTGCGPTSRRKRWRKPPRCTTCSSKVCWRRQGTTRSTRAWAKRGSCLDCWRGIGYIKTDEARHIGYGTFLLQRLICEHPHVYDVIVKKMSQLAPLAFQLYAGPDPTRQSSAYGVQFDAVKQFAQKQLSVRMDVLARARGKTIEELYKQTQTALET